MKKTGSRVLAFALACGAVLGVAGATTASAAVLETPRTFTAKVAERVSVTEIQPQISGACWLAWEMGDLNWGVPASYPRGTVVEVTARDGYGVDAEFLLSAGTGKLRSFKGSKPTTYDVKFVTPDGRESKTSTITYFKPYIGSCTSSTPVNGTETPSFN